MASKIDGNSPATDAGKYPNPPAGFNWKPLAAPQPAFDLRRVYAHLMKNAPPRRVIVESPYAGDVKRNEEYARRAMRDCLHRGEAPIASHLLYTQPGVLDDNVAAERQLGIDAGLAWGAVAEATVVYIDHGISSGMAEGIKRAHLDGRAIEFRMLDRVDRP